VCHQNIGWLTPISRQWRILRTIESTKQDTTVAELASQEECHPDTIWRDAAALHVVDSSFCIETRIEKWNLNLRCSRITAEPGGLCEVMSWVMGVSEVALQNALSFACPAY
jgi:hypothetical protein